MLNNQEDIILELLNRIDNLMEIHQIENIEFDGLMFLKEYCDLEMLFFCFNEWSEDKQIIINHLDEFYGCYDNVIEKLEEILIGII
ncbi:MAG: hypothetical protein H7836_08115 [Magnetococcus sp. YQC-3]